MLSLIPDRRHVLWVMALLVAAVGLRLYFIHAHSSYMQADEAVTGLMAKHILTRGDFPIFEYGEAKHGALIAYLVTPVFYLFGPSNFAFKSVSLCISVLYCGLVYLLGRRIGGDRVGSYALALTVFCPAYFVVWSVAAVAHYSLMLLFGVVALVLTDDLLSRRRLPGAVAFGALGLTLGVGFWIQPSIISFILAIWIVLLLRDARTVLHVTFPVFVVCFGLGALPALVFNLAQCLRTAGGLESAPNWISYMALTGRAGPSLLSRILDLPATLYDVITVSLPVMIGGSLWQYDTDPLRRLGVVASFVFWIPAITCMLVGTWTRRRKPTIADAVTLQFILAVTIFAISPFRWLVWEPRYLLPVFVFLPVAGACFVNWLHSKRPYAARTALVLVLVLNVVTSIQLSQSLDPDHAMWPDDDPMVEYLVTNGIEHPIANYRIAYLVAFASNERVVPVPINLHKFGMYRDVLSKPITTHYIFRIRGPEEQRLLDMFGYGESGKQWSAEEFAGMLRTEGVLPGEVRRQDFEHYAVFEVPHRYLDPWAFIRKTLRGWDTIPGSGVVNPSGPSDLD